MLKIRKWNWGNWLCNPHPRQHSRYLSSHLTGPNCCTASTRSASSTVSSNPRTWTTGEGGGLWGSSNWSCRKHMMESHHHYQQSKQILIVFRESNLNTAGTQIWSVPACFSWAKLHHTTCVSRQEALGVWIPVHCSVAPWHLKLWT